MEKDQAIALIKGRIMDEYRKHPQLDWADIAARKLYEQWNEYFKSNQSNQCQHTFIQKDSQWASCMYCGEIRPLLGN